MSSIACAVKNRSPYSSTGTLANLFQRLSLHVLRVIHRQHVAHLVREARSGEKPVAVLAGEGDIVAVGDTGVGDALLEPLHG